MPSCQPPISTQLRRPASGRRCWFSAQLDRGITSRPRRWSTLGRIAYIVCAVSIVFYVLFDVLDLDGSDFPTTRAAVDRTVVMVEVPKVSIAVYVPERLDLWVNLSVLLPTGPDRSFEHKALDVLTLLPLNTPRSHRYRVALPRSATIDFLCA